MKEALAAGERAKSKRRSGSENRQRQRKIDVRCDDEQLAEISAKAEAAGVSRSAFALATMLDTPPPRQRRVFALSPETLAVMARGVAAINRADNNANQIARELNQQKFVPDGGLFIRARNGDSGAILTIEAMLSLLQTTCAELREAASEIRRAAGYGNVHRG